MELLLQALEYIAASVTKTFKLLGSLLLMVIQDVITRLLQETLLVIYFGIR